MRLFQNVKKKVYKMLVFPKTMISKNEYGLFLWFLKVFGVSKIKSNWYWNHVHVQKPEKHAKESLLGSPNMKSKSYSSKMKQENSAELLGYSNFKLYNTSGPPDPPQTPNAAFPKFPRIS